MNWQVYQPTLKNRYKHVEIISFECPFVSVLFFKTLLSNKGYREEPRARSENPGGLVVLGGDNVSPLVEIGLTDLLKTGGLKPLQPPRLWRPCREEPRASTKKKACYYGLTGKKRSLSKTFLIILQYLFLPGFLEYLWKKLKQIAFSFWSFAKTL